jgi:hypothetical protein
MKNLFIILSTGLFMLFSCNKDDESSKTDENTTPTPTELSISSSDLATIGASFIYNVDTLATGQTVSTTTGSSQVWDYSGLLTHTHDTQLLKSPADYTDKPVGFASDADRVLEMSGDEPTIFLRVNSTVVDAIGMRMQFMDSVPSYFTFNNPLKFMEFPYKLTSTINDVAQIIDTSTFTFMTITYPAVYVFDFDVESIIDASGELTIPSGTYNCLREKRTQIINMVSKVDTANNGTYSLSLTLNKDTTTTYSFYEKTSGWSVMEITMDKDGSIEEACHLQ